MSRIPRRTQAGFTLVEIAIVLVIIGLLLGGILKGQEMITQARIKNIINDFNGITAAYFSYQDRYKAVPGDDIGATNRWAGSFSGNGDGVITGNYETAPPAGPLANGNANEQHKFWWHLRLAGFVAGPTANQGAWTQPTNSVGGVVGVQTTALGIAGLAVCSANIPDKIAGAVDTQIDDQQQNTGTIRGIAITVPNAAAQAGAPGAGAYAETGGTQFLICKSI